MYLKLVSSYFALEIEEENGGRHDCGLEVFFTRLGDGSCKGDALAEGRLRNASMARLEGGAVYETNDDL